MIKKTRVEHKLTREQLSKFVGVKKGTNFKIRKLYE